VSGKKKHDIHVTQWGTKEDEMRKKCEFEGNPRNETISNI
jgi:hypothetical protein